MPNEPNINQIRNQARRAARLNTAMVDFLADITGEHVDVYGGSENPLYARNLRTLIDHLVSDDGNVWDNFMLKAGLAPSQSPHNPSLTVRAIVVAALEEDLRNLTKNIPHEPDESVFDRI